MDSFAVDLDEIPCVATVICWSARLIYFAQAIMKGENSGRYFAKYAINVVLCLDTYEPNCFKLDVMRGTTKLYSVIPPWMALVFTLKVTDSLESFNLCSHCVVKLHEATQMFLVVHYVREITVKKFFRAIMDRWSICCSCFANVSCLRYPAEFVCLLLCLISQRHTKCTPGLFS